MLPLQETWRRHPGHGDGDGDCNSEGDEEEAQLREAARKHLPEVQRALGLEWADIPYVHFTTPDRPQDSSRPGLTYSAPHPSQWGAGGPLPRFKIERNRAPVLRACLESNGMREAAGPEWMLQWSGPTMKEVGYQALHEHQRVNHFLGSADLTQKDRLWYAFKRMAARYGGTSFDFMPETFVLPDQQDEFETVYKQNKNHIWIVKPHASSQGKGIFLLRDLSQLQLKDVSVISRYIDNPYLIQGLKFDMRIYVLVTSYEPLRCYIYREGLARFASKTYSNADEYLSDNYRHLTNYSINKNAKNFVENQDANADNVGHKWSISALNRHLKHTGVDVKLMWARIDDLVVKTLLSVESSIAAKTRRNTTHSSNCFELYGFDVLVDDVLKPWLIEVNLSPCMQAESPLDYSVKSSLLSDTFNLVGIPRADFQSIASARMRHKLLSLRHWAGKASGRPPVLPAAARPSECGAEGASDTDAGDSGDEAGDDQGEAQAASAARAAARAASRAVTTEEAEMLRPLALQALGTHELKTLAHAMQESGRRRNFIRLYPTRNSIIRYDAITSGRPASQTCTGPWDTPEVFNLLLFGLAPEKVLTEARQLRLQDSASPQVTVDQLAKQLAFNKEEREDEEEDEEDADPSVCNPIEATTKAACEPPRRELVETAIQTIMVLGTKVGSRLAFIEYLVRMCNSCARVGLAMKAKLVEGRAVRIATFRRQLVVFLRSYGRTSAAMAQVKELDSEGACLCDRLGSACAAVIARLTKDAWGAAVAVGDLALEAGSLTLSDCSPSAFARTGSGRRALEVLAGLGPCGLESILQDSRCASEYRALLKASAGDEASSLRQRMGELEPGEAPRGPLSELHELTGQTPTRMLATSLADADTKSGPASGTRFPSLLAQPQAQPRPLGGHAFASPRKSASMLAADPADRLRRLLPNAARTMSMPALHSILASASTPEDWRPDIVGGARWKSRPRQPLGVLEPLEHHAHIEL